MAVQTASETSGLKKKTFGQAAASVGWPSHDNGLYADEHPAWQKQNALQKALRAAAANGNNWNFGTVSAPPSTSFGQ